MIQGGFNEPSIAEDEAFLDQELREGISRNDLIEGMESLHPFVGAGTGYTWEHGTEVLVCATIARSARTYKGICALLRLNLPVQAAILTRTLFEDVIVTHWLAANKDEQDWFLDRFLQHRAAIAQQQERLESELGIKVGPPLRVAAKYKKMAEAEPDRFGKQASKDWWAAERDGEKENETRGLSLRQVVVRLEKMAKDHERYFPRFAGGEADLLDNIDRVVHKWLSQTVHHTVVGLPFAPSGVRSVEVSPDPMPIVGFSASWLFAQQIYLMFELNDIPYKHIDTVWFLCLQRFIRVLVGPNEADALIELWWQLYGDDEKESET